LTGAPEPTYIQIRLTFEANFIQQIITMRSNRVYYFAFTYRFFYGRGGPGEAARRMLMT
jgi:hypothetical protein